MPKPSPTATLQVIHTEDGCVWRVEGGPTTYQDAMRKAGEAMQGAGGESQVDRALALEDVFEAVAKSSVTYAKLTGEIKHMLDEAAECGIEGVVGEGSLDEQVGSANYWVQEKLLPAVAYEAMLVGIAIGLHKPTWEALRATND